MKELWSVDEQFMGPPRFPRAMSFAQPLLDEGSDLQSCSRGVYDAEFRSIANSLVLRGWETAYVRLGWEHNGGWYRWRAGEDYDGFVSCFRRAAGQFKEVSSRFKIEWNPALTSTATDVGRTYPGDDVVDIIAGDSYDGYPAVTNELSWGRKCHSGTISNPTGLCTLAAFARSRGKKLSVPEWGIRNKPGEGAGDNGLYIRMMYDFFEREHDILEYEAYFDAEGDAFELDTGANPIAAAEYRGLWSSN